MSNEKFTIKEAKIRDLERLTSVLIVYKRELTDFFNNDFKIFRQEEKSVREIKRAVEKNLLHDSHTKIIYIENVDGEIIAMSYGMLLFSDHLLFKPIKYGKIAGLWVNKEFRGKGLASMLKEFLFVWFKANKCKYIQMIILKDNPDFEIFMKWGFVSVLETMRKKI